MRSGRQAPRTERLANGIGIGGVIVFGGVVGCIANLVYGPNYLTGGLATGILVTAASEFKAEGCFVNGFPGWGIDVDLGARTVVSKCSVDGLGNGNGIRAGNAITDGNRVDNLLAVGIHAYPNTLVKHNWGSAWIVSADLHAPIHQDAVVLLPGAGAAAAEAFVRYLQGDTARAIVTSYGYER